MSRTSGQQCIKRRTMSLEALEARAMMAGDVTVEVTKGGDLKIAGDNQANQIEVYEQADGTWHIRGEEGTKINGRGQFTARNVKGEIRIDMQGGNDYVRIHDGVVKDDIHIQMGAGSDFISLLNVRVVDDLFAKLGSGNDTFVFNKGRVGDRFEVDTSLSSEQGNDVIYTADLQIRGKTVISTGEGKDIVTHYNTQFSSSLGSYELKLGGQDDTLSIRGNTNFKALGNLVDGQGGNDRFETDNSSLLSEFRWLRSFGTSALASR